MYLDIVFTKDTLREAEFLVKEFGLPAGSALLDVGCGVGRHTVELAKRGYWMTGVDLSESMLAEARKAARAAGVVVELLHADARDFIAEARFDGALCVCEGAFCLLGAGDDPLTRDLEILRNIYRALKPGARFILTALSAFRLIRQVTEEEVRAGRFDPLTLVEHNAMEVDTPDGTQTIPTRERLYVPTELAFMCQLAGFTVEHIGGGTAGNWGRRPLELDEYEIMVICRKPEKLS